MALLFFIPLVLSNPFLSSLQSDVVARGSIQVWQKQCNTCLPEPVTDRIAFHHTLNGNKQFHHDIDDYKVTLLVVFNQNAKVPYSNFQVRLERDGRPIAGCSRYDEIKEELSTVGACSGWINGVQTGVTFFKD